MKDFDTIQECLVKGLKRVVSDDINCDYAIVREDDVTMRIFMVLYKYLSDKHIVASSTRFSNQDCDLTILSKQEDKPEYALEIKYNMLSASRKDITKIHRGTFKWVISFDNTDAYTPYTLTFEKIKKSVSKGRRAVIHVCKCTDETNNRYKGYLKDAGFIVNAYGKGEWQIVLFKKDKALIKRFNPLH